MQRVYVPKDLVFSYLNLGFHLFEEFNEEIFVGNEIITPDEKYVNQETLLELVVFPFIVADSKILYIKDEIQTRFGVFVNPAPVAIASTELERFMQYVTDSQEAEIYPERFAFVVTNNYLIFLDKIVLNSPILNSIGEFKDKATKRELDDFSLFLINELTNSNLFNLSLEGKK